MASEIVANLVSGYGSLPDGTKHLSEPIITSSELNTEEQTTMEYQSKDTKFVLVLNLNTNIICKMSAILFRPQYVKSL